MEKMIKMRKVLECAMILIILASTGVIIQHSHTMFGLLALFALVGPAVAFVLTAAVRMNLERITKEDEKQLINMFDELLYFVFKIAAVGFSGWLIIVNGSFWWGLGSLYLIAAPYTLQYQITHEIMTAREKVRSDEARAKRDASAEDAPPEKASDSSP